MSDRARPALVEGLTTALRRLRDLGEHAVADEIFEAVDRQSGVAGTDLLRSMQEAARKARREARQAAKFSPQRVSHALPNRLLPSADDLETG